ncbi:MAG: Hsp20/alpha crystallin family protein [Cenarchaeum sp. SB0665_bin_23]|nr:Hsp20/alpha crystallin family protein [Cenarchaeum sp. SB0667_bin_13]MXY61803.1 Hsp20/alpha crystallin family protein [Cenarchaeum sp. SB0665_bin_23]MXZ93372.1 Hsp20/alpha crystallin family protein [Cenarchaeum sp. SB0666_bin_15]MYB46399.1 Hsp20/alpha crystallin family protein [Cenarchaeum sp. SB0662_bin_33]MYC80373.1 Hsp20/alpha crystallin family protein [Cenarchaeum sp. SB0661_bin_35]MYG33392.1 Hsp20/alpha crystallin family protein [Cenarchaeum sp. SB0677_bin_16]
MKITLLEDFDKIFGPIFSGNYPIAPSLCYCHDVTNSNNIPDIQTSRGNTVQIDTIHDKDNNEIKLVSEIPGVEKKDIQVVVDDNVVSIDAARGERKYRARIRLHQALSGDVSATYRNGILEITLGLNSRPQGREVKVE